MNNKYPFFKMRLWDKVTKTMYTPPHQGDDYDSLSDRKKSQISKNYNFKINLNGTISQYDTWCSSDVVPMLWTTYSDLNKVDIYDGDVLRPRRRNAKNRFVVKFVKGGFRAFSLTENEWDSNLEDCQNLIVCGNIYQNPELLEEK